MKPINRILAATDFSPLGNAAVERAIMLAAREKAKLHVVHAFPKLGPPLAERIAALRDNERN